MRRRKGSKRASSSYIRLYGVTYSRRIAILAGILPVGDLPYVHPRPKLAQILYWTNLQPLVRALRSMTIFLDKFREVDEAIKSHEAEADKWFETITAERSDNLEGSLAALTLEERKSHQQLNALLDDLSKPIKRMEAKLAGFHSWALAEGTTTTLQWFSPLPYQQYHVQASTDVLAGTGDWLLHDERLKAWRSSSCPSILWLRGPPGFGKTKLM